MDNDSVNQMKETVNKIQRLVQDELEKDARQIAELTHRIKKYKEVVDTQSRTIAKQEQEILGLKRTADVLSAENSRGQSGWTSVDNMELQALRMKAGMADTYREECMKRAKELEDEKHASNRLLEEVSDLKTKLKAKNFGLALDNARLDHFTRRFEKDISETRLAFANVNEKLDDLVEQVSKAWGRILALDERVQELEKFNDGEPE